MSNPKRKVTDLLPTEAILISSDAERDAVLKLMDEAGMKWNGGEDAYRYIPDAPYDYCLVYKLGGTIGITVRLKNHGNYEDVIVLPATDFIPTESDEVVGSGIVLSEPDDSFTIRINPDYERKLLVDYHNFILDDPKSKECDVVGESVELFLKTRNTPNQ